MAHFLTTIPLDVATFRRPDKCTFLALFLTTTCLLLSSQELGPKKAPHGAVLYCIMLYCAVLYDAAPCCTMLYYAVLLCIMLYYAVLR